MRNEMDERNIDVNGAVNEALDTIDKMCGRIADLGRIDQAWALRNQIEKIFPLGE